MVESRSRQPLVDMRMMRLRGVWTTNTAALLLGFGQFTALILIPQFVQAPASTGYGYGVPAGQWRERAPYWSARSRSS